MVAKSRSSSSFRYVSLTRSSTSSAGMLSSSTFTPSGFLLRPNDLSHNQHHHHHHHQQQQGRKESKHSHGGQYFGGGQVSNCGGGKKSHYYTSMWNNIGPPPNWNPNFQPDGVRRSFQTASYETKSSRLSSYPPYPHYVYPKFPCSKYPLNSLTDGLPAPPKAMPLVPMYVGNLYARKPKRIGSSKTKMKSKGCCGNGLLEWWRKLMRRIRRMKHRSKRKAKNYYKKPPPPLTTDDTKKREKKLKKKRKKVKKETSSGSSGPAVVRGNYYRWWEDDSSGFYGAGGGQEVGRRGHPVSNNSRTSLVSSRSRSNRLWFLDGFNPVPPPTASAADSSSARNGGGESSLRCLGRRSLIAHNRRLGRAASSARRDHWREDSSDDRASRPTLPAPPSATTASTIVGDTSPYAPKKILEIQTKVGPELLRSGNDTPARSSSTSDNAAVIDFDFPVTDWCPKRVGEDNRCRRHDHKVPPPPNRPLPPVPESRFLRVDTTTTTTTTTEVVSARPEGIIERGACDRVKGRLNHQRKRDRDSDNSVSIHSGRHRRGSVQSDITHVSESSKHRKFYQGQGRSRRSTSVESLPDSTRSGGFVRVSRRDYRRISTDFETFLGEGVTSLSLRDLTGRLHAYMSNWVFMDRNRSPDNATIPPPPPPPLSRHGSLSSLGRASSTHSHSSRGKSKSSRHEVERRRCRRQRSMCKGSSRTNSTDQLCPSVKNEPVLPKVDYEVDDAHCRWLTRYRRTNNNKDDKNWGTQHLSACAARLDELITNLTDSLCKSERMKRSEFRKARQRASVLWLVSKACENNTLPNDLKDPYYRDHEDQDKLKPMIIQGLSTAALYCSALANIYADPNYHSLNHHGILQVLMRKGVHVEEPSDMPLTETVLTQTAPIRMSAHMAVIEGIMALFIKEVLIPEKVVEVVSRFSMIEATHEIPNDAEDAAVLWINKCCVKLQHRIEEEIGSFHSPEESDPRQVSQRSPNVPIIQDLADLSDGCSLAAVLSFYCPDYLPWQEISFNEPVSLADSLYNLQLVQRFCEEQLPHDICFLTLEDFLYMHDTIKQCALAFLADLMFLFEIRPARCVVRPGVKEDLESLKQGSAFEAHRRHSHNGRDHRLRSFQQAVSPIPDLRSGGSVSSYGGSSFSLPDIHRISPRSNGPIPVRGDKTIERSPSARKIRGHEGSKSPVSPTSSLRRTNSVNLPDSDRRRSKSYPDTVAAGLPSKTNRGEEVRQKSDEDEEIAAYFANRDASLPFDAQPSSQARRELFPPDGQVPGNGKEGLEPLRPAYVKQSKERSNHDTKVQERGEDRRGPGSLVSKESGSPPEVIQRRKEVEDEYGTSPDRKEDNTRLSTGLADYYQQLAEETRVEDLMDKSPSGSPAKTSAYQRKDIVIAKLAEFTEKAALENVDPYSSNLAATTSFAQLSKLRDSNPNPAINIVYMQHDKEGRYPDGVLSSETMAPASSTSSNPTSKALKSSFLQKSKVERSQADDRHTSFATLPNTTTWQQQSGIRNHRESRAEENPDDSQPLAAQLNDIRLQLEERRRKIEQEKRRMETMLKKQRQKLGKAAFLQAVSKPGNAQMPTADGDSPSDNSECRLVSPKESSANGILPLQSNSERVSIKDIENDIDSVTRKWLKPGIVSSPGQTSPLEDSVSDDVINTEDFQNSIEQLNSSLSDLQADISRLSQRQYSIQDLAPGGGGYGKSQEEHQQHNFFLHKSSSGVHKPGDFQESVFQSQNQRQQTPQSQQQPQRGFVQSPRRGQWQNESTNTYSPSPQQQISPQVINTNTSPRRGQWGQPLPSHMTPPDQYQMPWQPHPMRPASVDPTHMMLGHPIHQHHPAYDHRSPSAVPFMDTRNQGGYPIHDGYGYQYPHHQPAMSAMPGMYQNGPVNPNQYDYNRGYLTGGNIPPHYDPMGNYSVMNYPGSQQAPHQIPGPHHQSFRLGQQENHPTYVHQPQQNTQIQQQASNFQPIVPDRETNYQEEAPGRPRQTQPTSSVDDFGRPIRSSISPERSPPSPPSKPIIGRTFRIPKGKTEGISPTKESSSPPRNFSDTEAKEEDVDNVSQSPPKNGPSKGGDGTDKTHFYISFDNDQPKKPKPKKPMRPREVKALSAASKVNGKQGSQDQSSGDAGSDTRKSPPLPASLSANTQASSDSGSEGKPQPAPRTRTQSVDEAGVGFFIGADLVNPDPEAECEMRKKKELIMMLSLRRRAEQESQRLTKEQEYAMQREQERQKQEEKDRKREDERIRRQQILENYRMRRQQEELDKDGGGPADSGASISRGHGGSRPGTLTKAKPRSTSATRPRPKSVHVTTHTREPTPLSSLDTMSRGSHLSLAGLDYQDDKDSLFSVGSGGTLTHRTLSPQSENSGPSRHLTSPTSSGGGGSRGPYLPPGFVPHHRTGPPSDGASDAGSTTSSAFTDYTGPKLFVKPAAKSNRGIILNAINTVLAGSVNFETKRKVLDEINRSESKHFLILFRDSGCQFRAMYSYNPDKEEVIKLYGIGPKNITAKMMDRFYKYNSGGKCFSEVQTKHLTVTIDAITIQNHLWSGKRAMAQKKDLF